MLRNKRQRFASISPGRACAGCRIDPDTGPGYAAWNVPDDGLNLWECCSEQQRQFSAARSANHGKLQSPNAFAHQLNCRGEILERNFAEIARQSVEPEVSERENIVAVRRQQRGPWLVQSAIGTAQKYDC